MSNFQADMPPGRRLLLPLLERIAQTDPERVYASIPKTNYLKDGYTDVTYYELARAVHRAAGWLEDTFGTSSTFETLAYIGLSDIRYFILVLAAPYVGYKFLLPSPRNSIEGQVALFKETKCTRLITSKGFPIQPGLLGDTGASITQVPELPVLLAKGQAREYKFNKAVEEAEAEPFIVLHTSGSTGLPKPIVLPHGYYFGIDRQQLLPNINGHPPILSAYRGHRTLLSMPPFHGAGIVMGIFVPLFLQAHVVCLPSGRPISLHLIEEALDYADLERLLIAPSILEDLSQSPTTLDKLSRLDTISYSGGPLTHQIGNMMSKRSKLMNVLGSTEIGPVPLWEQDSEDWEYFHHSPALKGMEFRPTGDGETYELVFVRHPSTDPYHGTWYTFPDLKEYSMNDIYSRHPSKPNLWLYVGRADDIIVLSNGEKFNPVSMQMKIQEHPHIKSVIVVGQGKFAVAAVIELNDHIAQILITQEDRRRVTDDIWSKVEEANSAAPGHGRLGRDKIILANSEKPFPRAGKGTVQRKAAIMLYQDEIEAIYTESGEDDLDGLPAIDLDVENLEKSIENLVRRVIHVETLPRNQDFFTAGMDSLHAMTITKKLRAAMIGIPNDTISPRLVYSNPTVSALATALKDNLDRRSSGSLTRDVTVMQLLERYLDQLPVAPSAIKRNPSDGLTVILTGSTGSLGSYLLDSLFSNKNITKIYCLNRRADAAEYQSRINAARGIISEWADRAVFLHADLSKANFGLPTRIFESLRNETSVIIHNQWAVNFNLALSSFEPFVEGSLGLIKLSASSPQSPPIYFTSSIGTLGKWNEKHPGQSVPEVALDDPTNSIGQGYSESKWVTERLLDAAGRKSGVSCAILRIGQIAGPVEGARARSGMWSRQEWVPSIIASSKYLGVIPKELGGQDSISWIPVDLVARICIDLIENDCVTDPPLENTWTKYYHLVNPKPGSWASIVPVIQDCLKGQKLEPIKFHEWVNVLEQSGKHRAADPVVNPALKLLDLYSDMAAVSRRMDLDATQASRRSKTMQELNRVNGEWMTTWMKQWDF